MAHYSGAPRYTRPVTSERPGPRFNPPLNRNAQRPSHSQAISTHSNKSTTETAMSTPSSSNSPSVRSAPSTDPGLQSTESKPLMATTTASSSYYPHESLDTKPSVRNDLESSGQKRSQSGLDSQQPLNERRTTQGGRCRLFIGNLPTDLTEDEFQLLFGNYGELVEYFVNPSRGFGFIKLSSRQLAEQAKSDLDGHVLRGKPLRIRFASQGATIKVKNLSGNVSNELLKEAFEQHFGCVERAVVIVDDRGKSTGEGIIEFEKKPSAQKCLNECTERCFFITSDLKPVIVEPWDIRDEEDGLTDKSLIRSAAYAKERESRPRFAEPNSIEQTVGLKWKELELQEKQLLEEVKRRMQYATEQMQTEIDQMYLEHQSQVLREELLRRQEDLRRIEELRAQELDRRRQMMPMHQHDGYSEPFNLPAGSANHPFHPNQQPAPTAHLQYNDFGQMIFPTHDSSYIAHQGSRGHGLGNPDGFERKRARY